MRKILIDKEMKDPKHCSYGFPWRHDGNCYNFRAPDECVTADETGIIDDMTDIEGLVIGCDLDDYSFISEMVNLRQLYIYSGENINDMSFIAPLVKLKHLYIHESHINSLDPLIALMLEQKRLLSLEKDINKRLFMTLEAVAINSDKELDGSVLKEPGYYASEIIVNRKSYRH